MVRPLRLFLPLVLLLAACESGAKAPALPSSPASAPARAPASAPVAVPTSTRGAQPAAGGVEEGKRLYFTACANCHGPDGTGAMMRAMLPKIGDLTSAEMHGRMKDEDIATLVANGRDKMPPLGAVLKPEQIQQIIAYVRTLKK